MNQRKGVSRFKICSFVFIIVSMLGICCLSGCGKETAQPADSQETVAGEKTENQDTEVVETVGEVTKENAEEVEVTQEETMEELVEEPVAEEPEVEMVDFETWAKQEGNDEVCLVHWNEELGIQEIMLTLDESKTAYEIQDGDRFAIPFRSNIGLIQILNGEKFVFENTEYLEIPLEKGVSTVFYIYYSNEKEEEISLCYVFK